MMEDTVGEKDALQDSTDTPWSYRWRLRCKLGLYPFQDGCIEDFEKVFENMVKVWSSSDFKGARSHAT